MPSTVIAHDDYASIMTPSFFEPSFYPECHAVAVGGRNAAFYVEHPQFSGVLRQYRRGGLIGKIIRTCYCWRGGQQTRSWAEFSILLYLYQNGFNVPKPIAACYQRHGLCYRAAIITERLPTARTLIEVLVQLNQEGHERHANAMQSEQEYIKSLLSERVAQAIFTMHRLGVYHADLNGFNILLTRNNTVYIIDFDKSRQRVVSKGQAEKNLNRLERHLCKLLGNQGVVFMADIKKIYRKLT